jgi:LysW-gamma-L-lysine carboxypeptidase
VNRAEAVGLIADAVSDAQISLLEDLVSIPSISGNERAAVDHLVGWMMERGAACAYVDAAGSAVGLFGNGPRQIVLLGHIDTVGGLPAVRREGNLLYGRGTVDAKGPLCAFAAAAASAEIPEGWQVVVIGAVEEECITSAGAHHAVTQFAPELCVIGEPSRWDRMTLGYKGRLITEIELCVPLSHSAGRADTAAERAVAVWSQIKAHADAYNEGRERAFDRLDATLMRLNTSDDGLHGRASMTVGFRLPVDITPDGLEAELRGLLLPHPPAPSPVPGEGERTKFTSHTRAISAPRDTALSRLFRAAIREEGGTPAFVMKTGTSDMNIAGPAWCCPILAYGPGDSALDHTPDEHIDLDEYLRAVRVLTGVIEALPVETAGN